MKTKKRTRRRRVLSVMLSLALLISMLPLSGGQVVKAAGAGYGGIYYSMKESTIDWYDFSVDYVDYIDEEGTFTVPDKIQGLPVTRLTGNVQWLSDRGKKIIIPASLNEVKKDVGGIEVLEGKIEEIHILCTGEFKGGNQYGMIYFFDANTVNPALKDIYFYPSDITDTPKDILCIDGWEDRNDIMLTMHFASQTVYDKFNTDTEMKVLIDAGKLIIKKDLDSSNAEQEALEAKRGRFARSLEKCEAMVEENYTKGSWAAIKVAVAAAKTINVNGVSGDVLDQHSDALDQAAEAAVSVMPIKEALGKVNIDKLQEDDYISGWQRLVDAVAAAQAVPDDATAAQVKALAEEVTKAYNALRKKWTGKTEIAWKETNSGPFVPPIVIKVYNDRGPYTGDGVTISYYKDEACTVPAVGEDATTPPTAPGKYYLRGVGKSDEQYTSSVSEVLEFTITASQVTWDGYQWDEATGELTITEDMEDFPSALEVPWYQDMSKITTVKIKEGVTLTRIGAYAFNGADNLQSFQIPATVKAVGDKAFYRCSNLEGTIALTDVTVGESAFAYCQKLQGAITLADTVTEITEGSFRYCGVKDIAIPASVTAIGKNAFDYSKAWEGADITLPAGVKTIGEGAFTNTGFASIKLPEGLESIGQEAFAGNTALKQIIIPASVQTIGGGLFNDCSSLNYVEIIGTGYNTETLQSAQSTVSGGKYDKMFSGTSPDIAVLCNGTTYETLASYAGVVEDGDRTAGWPASILRKTEDYLAETQAAYQADKQTLAGLQKADYTEATWNKLQEAIAVAETLLVQDGSTHEIIASRQAAQKKLAEGAAFCLQEILDGTRAFLAGENIEQDYDTESDSWWALQDALEDAEKTLQDSDASVAQIIKRLQDIQKARESLAPRDQQPGTSTSPSTNPSTQPSTNPSAKPSTDPNGGINVQPTKKPGNDVETERVTVKKVAIKKAKSTKQKTITVQWKKVAGVTGYQVQTALNKKFKKGKKSYTVKKAKTVKKTIKKLKRRKKYYVRVRAYKTVKGKKYYGKWSKVKTVKVK